MGFDLPLIMPSRKKLSDDIEELERIKRERERQERNEILHRGMGGFRMSPDPGSLLGGNIPDPPSTYTAAPTPTPAPADMEGPRRRSDSTFELRRTPWWDTGPNLAEQLDLKTRPLKGGSVPWEPSEFKMKLGLISDKPIAEKYDMFTTIPEGGHGAAPPIAGIIPSGTGLNDYFETVGLPVTYAAGSFIDIFNDVKSGRMFTSNPVDNWKNKEGDWSYNPVDEAVNTIKRQQERGGVTRAVSEGLIDVATGRAIVGGIRGGRSLFRLLESPVKAYARELVDEADRIAKIQGMNAIYSPNNFDNFRALEEFGLKPIAANNKFAAPLLPFSEALSDVATNTGIAALIAARVGVNPALLRNTDTGRALTAFQRQVVASESLVDTTVAAVVDSRTRRGGATVMGREVPLPSWVGTGNIDHVLPIDENGFFGGTGALWQDVFSKPLDPRWRNAVSPEARQLIDDYNWVTNVEIPRILEDAGIDLRKASRPDYEYYVPRDVQEIRGIETRRGSDPALRRHYEEATEGFSEGIRYNIDPRDTLALHLRWAYRKAAKKQLDDHLEPMGLTAREIIPQGIRDNYANSMMARRAVEQQRRRIRKGIVVAEGSLRRLDERVAGRETTSGILNKDIDELDDIITNLGEVQSTAPYRLEVRATNASVNKSRRSVERLNKSVANAEAAILRATTQTEDTTTLQSILSKELSDLEAEISRIEMAPHLRELTLDELDDAFSYAASPDTARWHQLTGRLKQSRKTGRGLAIRLEASEQRLIGLEDVKNRLEFVRDEAVLRRDLASLDLELANRDLVEASRQYSKSLKDAHKQAGSLNVARSRLAKGKVRGRRATGTLGTARRHREDVQIRLNILRDTLSAVDAKIPVVGARYDDSKKAFSYALEEARKAEVSPGNLWGPNQPNEIPIAMWRNRFLPREDVDLLKSVMEVRKDDTDIITRGTRGVEILGNTIRTMAATGDFAMPFIQGLPVLAENPKAWGKMLLRHHQAFVDPSVQARLIRDNLSDFQWLAQHGVPIGDPEFFAALKPGEGISADMLFGKLPRGEEARRFLRLGGRQTFGRFQASYNTGLGWSRVLLLQGLRDTWKGTDAELAHYIRNLTGGLDSRALGVSPSQRAAEGVWMAFSPRLLRSTMSLVWDAFNPVASVATLGRVQRTEVGTKSFLNLFKLSMGATLAYTLTGMAMQKDWDEIGAGLNPLNGKRFLSHQVNGDWIGIGGQIRAIAQLMAGMSIGMITEPASLVSFDKFENPLIKFLTSRGAPGVGLVGAVGEAATGGRWDALPYDEVDGKLDLLKYVGTSLTFFGVQGAIEGQNAFTTATGVFGARTSAETVFEKRDKARADVTEKLYPGRKYNADYPEGLDRPERAVVDADPTVIKAVEVVALKQREKKSKIQRYKDDVARKKDDARLSVAASAHQYGPGKSFRMRLPEIYEALALRLDDVRNDERHAEAMEFFDEIEPRTGPVDVATSDYYDTMHGEKSKLDNQYTGEYNMERHDELMAGLRRKHGDEVIDEVLRLNREGEHPLETQLREDRETLRPWWAIRKDIIQLIPEDLVLPGGMGGRELWLRYVDGSPTDREAIVLMYGPFINTYEGAVGSLRNMLRLHPTEGEAINRALVRQEYNTHLKTIASLNELQIQLSGTP
jgi:hypothetical protein